MIRRQQKIRKVSDLPNNILMDILSRIPVKDLYSCRLVCKTWLALLSDPYLAELHHSVAPTGILVFNWPLRDIRFIEFFESPLSISSSEDDNLLHRNVLNFRSSFNYKYLGFGNECNGLLLFCSENPNCCFYVCNPIINEYVPIPQPNRDNYWVLDFGLGFSPVTGQYKIIRYLSASKFYLSSQVLVEIHELSSDMEEEEEASDSWRSLGFAPPSFCNSTCKEKGPFLNGALHCLLGIGGFFESICCFDFVDESFRFLPSPSQFDDHKEPIRHMNFALLRNCLCITHFSNSNDQLLGPSFDLWMMTDYGVKDSWIKVVSIPDRYKDSMLIGSVTLWSNGETFMWLLSSGLLSFDPTTGRFKLIETYKWKTQIFGEIIPFVPSLVSLKNVVGEHYFKNLERGRRVRIKEKSLKSRVTDLSDS